MNHGKNMGSVLRLWSNSSSFNGSVRAIDCARYFQKKWYVFLKINYWFIYASN